MYAILLFEFRLEFVFCLYSINIYLSKDFSSNRMMMWFDGNYLSNLIRRYFRILPFLNTVVKINAVNLGSVTENSNSVSF